MPRSEWVETVVLKKITSSELMLGMYVERLGRSWLENPFWKRSFLLE